MSVHVTETTVDPQGRVVLDHLPFHPGERVDVVVRSHDDATQTAVELRGSVLRYEKPFDPVAEEDWEPRQ
jgi:FtsP/CotA-like multicopper oxidase with cupredoxin domain